MTRTFNSIGSGQIVSYYGRVIGGREVNLKDVDYNEISFSVETGYPKAEGEQYNPAVIMKALTTDPTIVKGDKVIVSGVLVEKKYNRKSDNAEMSSLEFRSYPTPEVRVVEESAPSTTANTTTKNSPAPAASSANYDDDF